MKKLGNFKWFLIGFMTCILISSLIITAVAAGTERKVQATLTYRDIKITLDGKEIIPKDVNGNIVEPFIIGGTTYLPVRAIAGAVGLDVKWDGDTSTVVLATPIIIIKGIEYSTDIAELDLSLKELTNDDIEPLRKMTKLINLNLALNQISDISPLKGLINLTSLSLWYNNINDISFIGNLTNLKTLYLFNNQISDISPLSGLTNLFSLDLSGNQIDDINVLSSLTNLAFLDLRQNKISDISPLKELTKLFSLHLSGNPLSQSQIEELQAALPNCQIIF